MNLSTQASKDILSKIERDPGEVRHWRQLLILCFDQKAIETLKTLQVIINGLENFWQEERRRARKVHEAQQKLSKSSQPLPLPAVNHLPLTPEQRALFIQVVHNLESVSLMHRLGKVYAEEFNLPKVAKAHFERALMLNSLRLEQEDLALRNEINLSLQKLNSEEESGTENRPAKIKKLTEDLFSPEKIGVKSPVHQHPSASSLVKRTGRLVLDPGKLQDSAANDPWPDTQRRMEELLVNLQERIAQLAGTPVRPLRLPRSIEPAQWLDFLESHILLLVSTLQVHGFNTPNLPEIRPETRYTVADHSKAVFIWLQMVENASLKVSKETGVIKLPEEAPPEVVSVPKLVVPETLVTTPAIAHKSEKSQQLSKIFSLIDSGFLTEAAEELKEMSATLEMHGQFSSVWASLGLAFQKNHELNKAIEAYSTAIDFNPDNMQAWFNQGMILHEEGAHQKALDCYERAVSLAPHQPKIWCNLGVLQFHLGRYKESVESLRQAVELKPDYARAWDNLATSLCALDELSEAEQCCWNALEYHPNYADPQFKLGTIYFQFENLEAAEKAFRAALQQHPTYPLAGHYLAMILARTQRIEEALPVCEAAVSPLEESLIPSMAWTEMGYHLYEKADFARAIKAYEKALTYTPEKAVVWLDTGVAYHQLGNLLQAQYHYEKATQFDAELPRAWHNLGVIRQALGNLDGAQVAFAEAERLLAVAS